MSFRRRLVLFAACSIVLSCSSDVDNRADPLPTQESVKIGLVVARTGSLSLIGHSMELSARMAIEEINEAGGINGAPVELILKDTKGDPTIGQQQAQLAINEGALGIVGALRSAVTIPIATNVTGPAGVAMISPSSTSPEITELNDFDTLFRTAPSDAFQGVALAEQIASEGVGELGVIYINDSYGRGLKNAMETRFNQLGGMVKKAVGFELNASTNFSDIVAELYQADEFEAVVLIAFELESAAFTREIASLQPQLKPRLFGVDANFNTALLVNGATDLIQGMQGTAAAPSADFPGFQTFLNKFEQNVGHGPEAFAEHTYDGIYLLALALEKAGQNSASALLSELRNVANNDSGSDEVVSAGEFSKAKQLISSGADIDYQGAAGAMEFDENGDLTSANYVIWQIVNGSNGYVFEDLRTIVLQ